MVEFFQKITDVLNKNEIPYMLSGSVAMSLYIVPRATRDFDFIIHLKPQDIDRFVENFKEGYYCDKEAIDLILSKLIWIQDYQSPIQIEDIKNLILSDNLDWDYINLWVTNLNLNSFNLLKS